MGSAPRKSFQPVPVDWERVGKVVLDVAYAIHTELGPGLPESVYQVAMSHVIESNGALVETEVNFPYYFEGQN
jgi:GxxExxY protein